MQNSTHSHFRKALVPLAVACVVAGSQVLAAPASELATEAGLNNAIQNGLANLQNRQDITSFADSIIVKYKDGTSTISKASTNAVEALSRDHGVAFKHHRFTALGSQVLKVGQEMRSVAELEKLAQEIARDPQVEYAEVNRIMVPVLTPNDSRYNEQWHYFESTAGIRAPQAWDTTNGAGVTVAVIDTGYRPHADLVGNILPGYDFITSTFISRDGNGRDSDARDPGDWNTDASQCRVSNSSWHGTHVAGTVAATTNNGTGVAGVAYGAKVVPIRALGRCGGTTADIADSMIWAAGGSVSGVPSNPNPAKVLNLSLGGGGSCSSTSQAAINSARANGAVVVVAAGNSNSNVANFTPASCSGVIAVASLNRSAGRSSFSNFGNLIDIAAPGGGSGGNILSTLNSGTQGPSSDSYAFYAGTSMAAPHVAGVAALMFAENPNLTPNEVESILKSSARSFPGGSNCSTSNCGDGILDAAAAVAAAGGGNPPPPPPPAGGELTNGVAKTGLSGSTGNERFYTLEVPAGATDLSFNISGGSGDADLYVRFGAAPTQSSWDCRPFIGGNNETCNISNVQTGTYHVMVRAYSTYSGVSLVGSFTEGGGGGGGGGGDALDFNVEGTTSYGGQDRTNSGSVDVLDSGATLRLTGNRWRKSDSTFNVTANTVIEFDFGSTNEGEIHGIGFDSDNGLSSNRVFKLHGTQNWGITNGITPYGGGNVYQTYRIRVGDYFTGNNMRIIFVNDKDSGAATNNSYFRNVRVFNE